MSNYSPVFCEAPNPWHVSQFKWKLWSAGGARSTAKLHGDPFNNCCNIFFVWIKLVSLASSPLLHFLYPQTITWPPAKEAYCRTTAARYGGYRMQRSGLECHPRATQCWVSRHWQGLLALLSPWQLNYSLKERKAQGTLLISQWDCWLSSH